MFHLFCINVKAGTVSSLINVEVGLGPLVFVQPLHFVDAINANPAKQMSNVGGAGVSGGVD